MNKEEGITNKLVLQRKEEITSREEGIVNVLEALLITQDGKCVTLRRVVVPTLALCRLMEEMTGVEEGGNLIQEDH